jgi:hypothetical protein
MISEAHEIIQTSPEPPQRRTARALELLGDSVTLPDYLLTAVVLGKMGRKRYRTARAGVLPADRGYAENESWRQAEEALRLGRLP